MISNKIRQAMISLNRQEGTTQITTSAIQRIKTIILIILRYSDTPIIIMNNIGISFQNNVLLLDFSKIGKVMMMSLGSIKKSLENSNFSQLDITVQNHSGSEWRAFKIPRKGEGQSFLQVMANKKFISELDFNKQSNRADTNVSQSPKPPTYCNPPHQREILCSSTKLFGSNPNEKQEKSFKYLSMDTYTLPVFNTKKISTTTNPKSDSLCLLISKTSPNILTFDSLYHGDQILSESIFPTEVE